MNMKTTLIIASFFFSVLCFQAFGSEMDLIDTLVKIEQERSQEEKEIQDKYARNCEAMLVRQLEMLTESRKECIDAGNLEAVLAVDKMTEAVKESQIILEVGISLAPWDDSLGTGVPETITTYRKTTQEGIESELRTSSERMFREELEALAILIRNSTKQDKIDEAVAIKEIRDGVQKDFDHYAKKPTCPFGWKNTVFRFPKEKNIELFDPSLAQQREEKLHSIQSSLPGPVARLEGCGDWTEAGAMNLDGTWYMTGSNINDSTARLFEISTQKLLGEMPNDGPVMDVAFHPTLPLLISADTTPKIHVFNAATFENHAEFSPMPHCNVMRIAIHKDGAYAIAGSDQGRVFAWDTDTGKVVKEFEEGHAEEVRDIVFHPGGKMFATVGADGALCFWSMESSTPIRKIEAAAQGDLFCARFSPDGTKLAITSKWSEGYALLYDVPSGEQVNNFGGYGHSIRSAGFSPDGRFLVTGDVDFRVVIWDIATKEPLWSDARNMGNHIYRVQFTPDQKSLLVVAGFAPTIYNLPEDFAVKE